MTPKFVQPASPKILKTKGVRKVTIAKLKSLKGRKKRKKHEKNHFVGCPRKLVKGQPVGYSPKYGKLVDFPHNSALFVWVGDIMIHLSSRLWASWGVHLVYLDVPGRKLGSMVRINGLGKPILIYIYIWVYIGAIIH